MNIAFLKENNLVCPTYLIFMVKKYTLKLEDFLLLLFFWNYKEASFDVLEIAKVIKLSETEILSAFTNLMEKKLVRLDVLKDSDGKRIEVVNLEQMYLEIDSIFQEQTKEEEKEDIYSIFETEFGRPISSMEYEIINAWSEKGFSEELILGALKEAVYNGVSNLRYIDKILYEWQRKGYKNMKDVESHSRNSKTANENVKTEELFDYNWLEENEG